MPNKKCLSKIWGALLFASNFFAADLLLAAPMQTINPNSMEDAFQGDGFRIAQFLSAGDSPNVVIVDGGKRHGIVDGAIFTAYRQRRVDLRALEQNEGSTKDAIWVETGTLKAIEVKDHLTVAAVVEGSTAIAKIFFPRFPGIMAGDTVRENRIAVNPVQIATPSSAIEFSDIFDDPKANPRTYELSQSGKDKLREAAKAFMNAHLPVLLVEGHTDGGGTASANQVESQERAAAVRQYLVTELKFDPKKVVAMGFGEAEPAVEGYAPGAKDLNRRIVLKAVADHNAAEVPPASEASVH